MHPFHRLLRLGVTCVTVLLGGCDLRVTFVGSNFGDASAEPDASVADASVAADPSCPQGSGPAALHCAASRACAEMPIRSTGTVHYFCDCGADAQKGCVPGDDTAGGTSPEAAKRSWSEVVNAIGALRAGDTVALCRGGAWAANGVVNVLDTGCVAAQNLREGTHSSTCDIRDYTPSWGGTAKPLVRQTAAADLFVFWNGSSSGVRILNLHLEGGGDGPEAANDIGQRAIATGNHNDDFLICNNTINGWLLGIHVDNTADASGIDLWGNRITRSSRYGYEGPANDGTCDANYFDDNGRSAFFGADGATNVSFVNNEVHHSGGAPCSGATLLVQGGFDGFNIENNLIDVAGSGAMACTGIQIDNGGVPFGAYYRHLTIRRNLLLGIEAWGMYVSEAPGAVIENNIVVAGASNACAICSPSQAHRTSPADDASANIVFRNNTFYLGGGSAISTGIEGTGYVIANNSVYYTGGAGKCFDTPLGADAYAFIGNNACFGYASWGTSYDSPATRVTDPPLYREPPSDFTPLSGSPLIGKGSATFGATVDLDLKPRPNPPSIGAMEP